MFGDGLFGGGTTQETRPPSLAATLTPSMAARAGEASEAVAREQYDSRITWPLTSNVIRKRKFSNTYGAGIRNGGVDPHQGWDLEAAEGTYCFAIARGKVIYIEDFGEYGLQMCLSFQATVDGVRGDYFAFYAHLQKTLVGKGASVTPDTIIAWTGKSGNAKNFKGDEVHLHFEIRTRPYCTKGFPAGRVDPAMILGPAPLTASVKRSLGFDEYNQLARFEAQR
jgi:murein DD-endopeptidase MepM/ murein hydrolase activator NlpD